MGFRVGLLSSDSPACPRAVGSLREDGHEVIRPQDLQIRSRACGVTGVRPLGRFSPLRRGGVDHGPG
jgi:hypothetical protein